MKDEFTTDLEALLNKHSKENNSDSPDYVLAQYLQNCLSAYEDAVNKRDKFHNFNPWSHA